jgi:cytochrome P450
MALVSELELPAFDFMDTSLRGDRFHETMASLRGQGWLAAGELGFFVLDREASEFILRSKKVKFPGLQVAEVFGVTEGPLYEEITRNILNIDGDDHRRLRNLVNPALTPRAVERYRPAMRGFIGELFGKVGAAGRCEFVDAIAKPYPALVIATVMGAPLEDASRLYYWSNWIQRQFSADLADKRDVIEQAVVEFYEYVGALLERRRADPGDDLVSRLLAAEHDGDRLSDVECVNLVLNVLIGGVDTSQSQLAHAVRLLAQHPDQWRLLAEDPSLAGRAVEEALRYEPIVPFTARIVMEEFDYRDVTFPAGTIVMISAFDGNRDPDMFASPEAFDITADRERTKPMTFGAGIHYCLGANVARAELQEALAYLPGVMPSLELDGEPEFDSINGIYGLDRLPIRWQVAQLGARDVVAD